MFRTCPATGRIAHQFDRETHRCRCGRWERGFKPKTTNPNARDRGECQICEAKFSMTGGRMGHHGYKRPGCGYILGDCMGVGYAPYPATDALEIYRKAIEGRLASVEEAIAFYRSPECKGVTASRKPDGYFNMPRHARYEVPYTILRGAPYDRRNGTPSFEDALRGRIANLENEAEWYRSDLKRIAKRIAGAGK